MGDIFIKEGYKFYHNLIRNKFDLTVFFKLRRIIKKNNIHVIYLINQPLTIFWGLIIGKVCNIPVIAVIHNTVVVKEAIKLNIYRLFLPFVTKILTVAKLQKEHLIKNERLPEHLITVIYNGIEPGNYNKPSDVTETKKILKLNSCYKTVGIVTRLVPLKGIDIFLKAAEIINRRYEAVQFVIVGDGPEMSKLKSLSAELNLEKKVHFLGARNDIEKLLPVFDVAVLSSRTEALPITILEYMAARRAVVATNVGGVSELVIEGNTGFLVSPENPKALADKVLCLLEDEQKAQHIGANANKLVHRKFSIQDTVNQTEKLLKEIVYQ